ncbi:putative powdery mildew-specific protein [Blumeria hordei DH14]|uniref:Putative powdery mildew-specific protein n=1 Tax=Blumeria graminis f. sp. hordei (strain DH14) TaxID=546991 RepID=N1JE04_BLUG1|nr:putative powdery mildew-specific protein [Blumeria hordei DH14]
MSNLEIQIASSLTTLSQPVPKLNGKKSKDKLESYIRKKLDILLGFKPSSLILIPEGFEPRGKNRFFSGTAGTQLIIIAQKIEDLKLVCFQPDLRQAYHEWGILELCGDQRGIQFLEYFQKLFNAKNRVAVSVDDMKSAPIVELGKFSCLKLNGVCTSPRPRNKEITSALRSKDTSRKVSATTMSMNPTLAPILQNSSVVVIVSTLVISLTTSLLPLSSSTDYVMTNSTINRSDHAKESNNTSSVQNNNIFDDEPNSKSRELVLTSNSKSTSLVFLNKPTTTPTKSDVRTIHHHHIETVTKTVFGTSTSDTSIATSD